MGAAGLVRRVLFVVAVLAVAVAIPVSADTSPPAQQEIAKAPTDAAPPTAAVPAEAPSAQATGAATEASGAAKPTIRRIEIALLADPAPPAGSAADFVEQALACQWARDYLGQAESLQSAVSAEPGTPDAARALVMLGETYSRLGRTADSDQAFSQVAAVYADAETQALAATARSIATAIQRGDPGAAKEMAVSAADAWRGTESGAWALLKAGEIEREYLNRLEAAIPYYREVMATCPGTLAAEEAEVAVAECYGWSWEHPDEAIDAFQGALEHVTNLRLRIQAVIGLADVYSQAGNYGEALALFSDFLDQYPDHPSVPIVRIYRGYAASKRGDWVLAAEDAQAFLDSPSGKNANLWGYWAHIFLGQYAFAMDDLALAEDHFAVALGAVRHEVHALGHAGIAQCQAARGDMRGAALSFLQAADEPQLRSDQALRLYQAYRMAEQAHDAALQRQIKDRMGNEFPDSSLTTRVFGYELLSRPEI